ncbi:MAG: hypothetical protein R3231_02420 [bacterium]|nr:hypothetical protein [bacterium]
MENNERVVKKGRFLHDGLVFGDVEIIETESTVLARDNPGPQKRASGNGQTSFEIRCTLSTEATDALRENGACKSLDEAVARVEACCEELTWAS